MKKKAAPSGVLLLAKKSGLTSFSSLWSVKRALDTDKVGHTGTLDSFADGLLVVLTGHVTHLVPHVTAFTKTYQAVVCFGKETDTLDPSGKIVSEGRALSREEVQSVLPNFTGAILQTPPAFSALHVNGKRASDAVREGKEVHLDSRQIFVYKIEILDFAEDSGSGCSYGLLEITCSKGTYIRALARDIASSLGSCAHLSALRRTKVGPFSLSDAALNSQLEPFTIAAGIESEKRIRESGDSLEKTRERDSAEKLFEIKNSFMFFNSECARKCGFSSIKLKSDFEKFYFNGRPLSKKMFDEDPETAESSEFYVEEEKAVFAENGAFCGMVGARDGKYSYGFVVPQAKKEFRVFSWNDVVEGKFPVEFMKRGTAMSVGNFEFVHSGHQELLHSVYDQRDLVPGVVTFSKNLKHEGEFYSLEKRLDLIHSFGMEFAIVVDFTPEFSALAGEEFFGILSRNCGLRFLAEGTDFKCGKGGACGMDEIKEIGSTKGFSVDECTDVYFNGKKVSSTRIRQDIECGELSSVAEMLGRPFILD